MNQKFNLYSRTEEEKTHDMLVYETKAKARDICKKFEKIKKRSNIATVISAIACCAVAIPFLYMAYSSESIVAMLLILLSVIVLTVAVRLSVGAVLSHSLKVFVKWSSLSSKWKYAREELQKYEEKLSEQKVFEDDVKEVEDKLIALSKKLISFAEKNKIEYEN